MHAAPELPLGYAGSILLALVPPLWRRVMDEKAGLGMAGMKPFALWLGFAAMCLGMFMAVLDIQVVASVAHHHRPALHIRA